MFCTVVTINLGIFAMQNNLRDFQSAPANRASDIVASLLAERFSASDPEVPQHVQSVAARFALHVSCARA